jgi:NADH:ubiquinone oxidoreductase subunit 6 (subunit J)
VNLYAFTAIVVVLFVFRVMEDEMEFVELTQKVLMSMLIGLLWLPLLVAGCAMVILDPSWGRRRS